MTEENACRSFSDSFSESAEPMFLISKDLKLLCTNKSAKKEYTKLFLNENCIQTVLTQSERERIHGIFLNKRPVLIAPSNDELLCTIVFFFSFCGKYVIGIVATTPIYFSDISVSDRIQTDLNGISSALFAISTLLGKKDENLKYINEIRQTSRRIFKAILRLDMAGHLVPIAQTNMSKLSVAGLIQKVTVALDYLPLNRTVKITTDDLSSLTCLVLTDESALRRIFFLLISVLCDNSDCGNVDISAKEDGGTVCVEITADKADSIDPNDDLLYLANVLSRRINALIESLTDGMKTGFRITLSVAGYASGKNLFFNSPYMSVQEKEDARTIFAGLLGADENKTECKPKYGNYAQMLGEDDCVRLDINDVLSNPSSRFDIPGKSFINDANAMEALLSDTIAELGNAETGIDGFAAEVLSRERAVNYMICRKLNKSLFEDVEAKLRFEYSDVCFDGNTENIFKDTADDVCVIKGLKIDDG